MPKENPADFKYTKEHEWVKIDSGFAVVGITDFAQHQLTDIVFVELPKLGKEVLQGKNLTVVESVKSVSDVFAPVSGTVTEVNRELEGNPALVNLDAFGKGWIVKLKPKDLNELNNLLTAEQYEQYVASVHH